MSAEAFLGQAAVYLGAAVLAVPIAQRLGLGSVLGYLVAGVAIGPWGVRLVADSTEVMHFAEFGVVMMLFLVGLELDPQRLWRLRGPVFGLGGVQVAGTAAAVAIGALLLGLPWQQGVALGLILAMSSTAIGLQTLSEKNLLKAEGGQTSFAILLFQDVAVIPILALFPLLATLPVQHAEGGHTSFVDALPAWQHALVVLGAIGAVVAAGRLVIGPVMRAVARTGLREMFTASALLIVVSVAWLMSAVGLSAALGTFVAGVVLANSEYRHELEADVEPFKGLLLGVFFMAVGASIDFGLLLTRPLAILALLAASVVGKALVLAAVGRLGGLARAQSLLVVAALSQVGEFAFVLFTFAELNGILPTSIVGPMVAVTAFSMAATPLLFVAYERIVPRLAAAAAAGREPDVQDDAAEVIVAGYGRFGQITGRLLRSHGYGVTVLDVDSEQIDVVARFGQKAYFGDASRQDMLHAAGAARAKVLVVAVDAHEQTEAIIHTAKKHFPHLAILARVRGRTEAYDLAGHGLEGLYRETFDSAVRVGADTMRLLGMPAHAAARAARLFREEDERVMRDLAGLQRDQAFVSRVRERMRDFEAVLQADREHRQSLVDHGWDGPPRA